MPDGAVIGREVGERFFSRLPARISDGLSAQQRDAIGAALCAEWQRPPPVNIRLSIPLLVGRWYIALFAGRERRREQRLRADRAAYPLRTAGNFLFITAGAVIFFAIATIGVLLYSSVLDF